MHVSRQPNSKRWVQSNSPFSLVLRDRVDSKLAVAWSKLAVAWSKLLAKVDWDWEWDWLREQWDGEAGEWECEWRKWVTWISVWEGETVSESVRVCVCSVWERGWGWGWVRVQSDLCEVSEALFLKMPDLKSSIRHSVSLSSTWKIKDRSWNWVFETQFHFK